jgi:cyclophilin family peptidyl-prolyl cis-trans isomerase
MGAASILVMLDNLEQRLQATARTEENDMPNRVAEFDTTHGTFKVELFEERAPITTKNFIDLIEKKYYDGVVFHRVIADFMLQGGDPEGTGRGGPGYTIADEFHPELTHGGEGMLSMANAGPDTGGSQFFITLAATAWLDGKHAVFGRVIEGLEVIRHIGAVATGAGDRPLEDVVMTTVRIAEATGD